MSPEQSEEISKMITELKIWAGAKYGRKAEIARRLGVSRGLVGDWLAGRATPNAKNFLALRSFWNRRRDKDDYWRANCRAAILTGTISRQCRISRLGYVPIPDTRVH